MFSDEMLAPYLDGVNVKSDEQRIQEVNHSEIYSSQELSFFLVHVYTKCTGVKMQEIDQSIVLMFGCFVGGILFNLFIEDK